MPRRLARRLDPMQRIEADLEHLASSMAAGFTGPVFEALIPHLAAIAAAVPDMRPSWGDDNLHVPPPRAAGDD